MTMDSAARGQAMPAGRADSPFTTSEMGADAIPVRNGWHMLLYPWNWEGLTLQRWFREDYEAHLHAADPLGTK